MKGILTYGLKHDHSTAIYFSLEDLISALKCEIEDYDENSLDGLEYEVIVKMMTEKEIEELPEFDGY